MAPTTVGSVRSTRLWRYLACVAIGLVLIRLLGPAWRTGFPTTFPDSSSYLAVSNAGPVSWEFWFGQRPPTYPLLIWLVGPSVRAVVVAQTLLAIAAWAWLISTVWRQVRIRALASALIVVLLGTALQTRWLFWNTGVLTEGLSATLAVAGVAAWWRWWDEPSRFRTVVAIAVTIAWMLLRDSNAVTFLATAVPAFIVVLRLERRRSSVRRRYMAIALTAVLVAGGYSIAAQVASARGETSFHNNVGLRWLPDAEMSAWMEARGMPLSDALVARSGKDAWADGEAMLRAPELDEYRDWAEGRGRLAAAASFVVKADWYLERFHDELGRYTGTDHLAYDTFDVASDFPERPLWVFDPVGARWSVYLWAMLAFGATGYLLLRDRTRGWMALFLVVPVVVDMYLVFVADAVEVGRHLIGPMLRLGVVAPIVLALAAEAALRSSGQPPDSEVETSVDTASSPESSPDIDVDQVAGPDVEHV